MIYQGIYFIENPSSTRILMSEFGTFLLSSLRISDKGRLMPEVGTASFSSLRVSGDEEKAGDDFDE